MAGTVTIFSPRKSTPAATSREAKVCQATQRCAAARAKLVPCPRRALGWWYARAAGPRHGRLRPAERRPARVGAGGRAEAPLDGDGHGAGPRPPLPGPGGAGRHHQPGDARVPGPDARNGGGDRHDATERRGARSEEHTSELQSLAYLVCRLLLEKKKLNHGSPRTARFIIDDRFHCDLPAFCHDLN